jgi:hypothetical protein
MKLQVLLKKRSQAHRQKYHFLKYKVTQLLTLLVATPRDAACVHKQTRLVGLRAATTEVEPKQ